MDERKAETLDPAPSERDGHRPLVATLTLGCKLNQAETQSLARELERAGCIIVDRPVPADGYLINTCTITHVADAKARRLVRMVKRLSPNAPVVVTGCYAERAGEALARETGADVVLGNADKQRAGAALLEALGGTRPLSAGRAARAAPGRTRAFVKIQEGCDDVCAFCIVPRVRGRERAIPIPEVVRAAQAREAAGALEIVLTGTQPGAYGRDRSDGTSAAGLLAALLAETALPRIRYSSIQPQDVTPEFLAQWEDARLCRHFHLALQSGSDPVLRRMRRRYDAGAFLRALDWIRLAVPGAAVTTDVIAGFPQETDADFQRTLATCEEAAFADLHVFPYSSRPGTSAALLPDDVPPPVKRERVQTLLALAERSAARYRERLVGTVQPVLFEGRRARNGRALWQGLTDTYVPVHVPVEASSAELSNRLASVRVDSVSSGAVHGRVLA